MCPMALAMKTLGVETWGNRLNRAYREYRATTGRHYRDVAALVSRFAPITHVTIQRLEKLPEAPTESGRRFVAFLTVLFYGFDPEDFGLSADDVPPGIDRKALKEALERHSTCSAAGTASLESRGSDSLVSTAA